MNQATSLEHVKYSAFSDSEIQVCVFLCICVCVYAYMHACVCLCVRTHILSTAGARQTMSLQG